MVGNHGFWGAIDLFAKIGGSRLFHYGDAGDLPGYSVPFLLDPNMDSISEVESTCPGSSPSEWIDDAHAGVHEISTISRDDGQTVDKRSCCDEAILDWHCFPD